MTTGTNGTPAPGGRKWPWKRILAGIAAVAALAAGNFWLLAHFGGQLASHDLSRVGLTVLVLGAVMLAPLAWRLVQNRRKS